jgi:hypothetical protein
MKISPDFKLTMTVTEKAFILNHTSEMLGDKIDPVLLITHKELEDMTRL